MIKYKIIVQSKKRVIRGIRGLVSWLRLGDRRVELGDQAPTILLPHFKLINIFLSEMEPEENQLS